MLVIPALAGDKSKRDPTWAACAPYVVARGTRWGEKITFCPVWGDELPYKSFTTIVDAADFDDARYSCEYVHGGGSVRKWLRLGDGRVAIRSDYKAW